MDNDSDKLININFTNNEALSIDSSHLDLIKHKDKSSSHSASSKTQDPKPTIEFMQPLGPTSTVKVPENKFSKKNVLVIFVIENTKKIESIFSILYKQVIEKVILKLREPVLISSSPVPAKVTPNVKFGSVYYGDQPPFSNTTISSNYFTSNYRDFGNELASHSFGTGGTIRCALLDGLVCALEMVDDFKDFDKDSSLCDLHSINVILIGCTLPYGNELLQLGETSNGFSQKPTASSSPGVNSNGIFGVSEEHCRKNQRTEYDGFTFNNVFSKFREYNIKITSISLIGEDYQIFKTIANRCSPEENQPKELNLEANGGFCIYTSDPDLMSINPDSESKASVKTQHSELISEFPGKAVLPNDSGVLQTSQKDPINFTPNGGQASFISTNTVQSKKTTSTDFDQLKSVEKVKSSGKGSAQSSSTQGSRKSKANKSSAKASPKTGKSSSKAPTTSPPHKIKKTGVSEVSKPETPLSQSGLLNLTPPVIGDSVSAPLVTPSLNPTESTPAQLTDPMSLFNTLQPSVGEIVSRKKVLEQQLNQLQQLLESRFKHIQKCHQIEKYQAPELEMFNDQNKSMSVSQAIDQASQQRKFLEAECYKLLSLKQDFQRQINIVDKVLQEKTQNSNANFQDVSFGQNPQIAVPSSLAKPHSGFQMFDAGNVNDLQPFTSVHNVPDQSKIQPPNYQEIDKNNVQISSDYTPNKDQLLDVKTPIETLANSSLSSVNLSEQSTSSFNQNPVSNFSLIKGSPSEQIKTEQSTNIKLNSPSVNVDRGTGSPQGSVKRQKTAQGQFGAQSPIQNPIFNKMMIQSINRLAQITNRDPKFILSLTSQDLLRLISSITPGGNISSISNEHQLLITNFNNYKMQLLSQFQNRIPPSGDPRTQSFTSQNISSAPNQLNEVSAASFNAFGDDHQNQIETSNIDQKPSPHLEMNAIWRGFIVSGAKMPSGQQSEIVVAVQAVSLAKDPTNKNISDCMLEQWPMRLAISGLAPANISEMMKWASNRDVPQVVFMRNPDLENKVSESGIPGPNNPLTQAELSKNFEILCATLKEKSMLALIKLNDASRPNELLGILLLSHNDLLLGLVFTKHPIPSHLYSKTFPSTPTLVSTASQNDFSELLTHNSQIASSEPVFNPPSNPSGFDINSPLNFSSNTIDGQYNILLPGEGRQNKSSVLPNQPNPPTRSDSGNPANTPSVSNLQFNSIISPQRTGASSVVSVGANSNMAHDQNNFQNPQISQPNVTQAQNLQQNNPQQNLNHQVTTQHNSKQQGNHYQDMQHSLQLQGLQQQDLYQQENQFQSPQQQQLRQLNLMHQQDNSQRSTPLNAHQQSMPTKMNHQPAQKLKTQMSPQLLSPQQQQLHLQNIYQQQLQQQNLQNHQQQSFQQGVHNQNGQLKNNQQQNSQGLSNQQSFTQPVTPLSSNKSIQNHNLQLQQQQMLLQHNIQQNQQQYNPSQSGSQIQQLQSFQKQSLSAVSTPMIQPSSAFSINDNTIETTMSPDILQSLLSNNESIVGQKQQNSSLRQSFNPAQAQIQNVLTHNQNQKPQQSQHVQVPNSSLNVSQTQQSLQNQIQQTSNQPPTSKQSDLASGDMEDSHQTKSKSSELSLHNQIPQASTPQSNAINYFQNSQHMSNQSLSQSQSQAQVQSQIQSQTLNRNQTNVPQQNLSNLQSQQRIQLQNQINVLQQLTQHYMSQGLNVHQAQQQAKTQLQNHIHNQAQAQALAQAQNQNSQEASNSLSQVKSTPQTKPQSQVHSKTQSQPRTPSLSNSNSQIQNEALSQPQPSQPHIQTQTQFQAQAQLAKSQAQVKSQTNTKSHPKVHNKPQSQVQTKPQTQSK
ncbi:hypothetical protein AYI68_g3977, partial [Smittium mucronatum]